jgi:hypothetical protein
LMPIARLKRRIYYPAREAYRRYKNRQAFKRRLRPTDVFLVGHPKSGNTWLTLMLAVLIENNFNHKVNLNNVGEFIPSFHNRDGEIAKYTHFPNPRIFRNEGPVYADLYPKTVYIVRDPRAAYVSYYHHCVHDTGREDWKMEDFIEEMLANGCIKSLEPYLQRWDRHVGEWLERAKRQPVLFVKYEEMKQDRKLTLKRVVDFIGLPCSEARISQAIDRGDFKSMRKEELIHGAEPYSGTKGQGGYFVRKGKIDGWKEELPAHSAGRISTEFAWIMRKMQYV